MLSGHWTLALYVNPSTSIAQALLPFYSATSPSQGTKKARDSILKLITGMHDDVSPLPFQFGEEARRHARHLLRGVRVKVPTAHFERKYTSLARMDVSPPVTCTVRQRAAHAF